MKPIQIYIGNDETIDEPQMPEPKAKDFKTLKAFCDAMVLHSNHIATLETHKVIGPHSWKVGQRLEEGVDFRRKERYYVLYEKDDTTSGSISFIATGINDCYSQFENNIGTPARQIINVYSETVIIPIEGEQELKTKEGSHDI